MFPPFSLSPIGFGVVEPMGTFLPLASTVYQVHFPSPPAHFSLHTQKLQNLCARTCSRFRQAGRVGRRKYELLVEVIREVLQDAIAAGGTTLRDFVNGEGKPGYFRQHLSIYGRTGEPCISCRVPVRKLRIGQRSTFYCPKCQK